MERSVKQVEGFEVKHCGESAEYRFYLNVNSLKYQFNLEEEEVFQSLIPFLEGKVSSTVKFFKRNSHVAIERNSDGSIYISFIYLEYDYDDVTFFYKSEFCKDLLLSLKMEKVREYMS